MSQTLNASPHMLREAFYVLSMAQDVPDAKLLDQVVRRYPQFSEELTEFAIAIAIDALRGDRASEAAEAAFDPKVVSPAVSRAMSHFQNRLYALSKGKTVAQAGTVRPRVADAPNPFQGLSRDEFRAVGRRLNANTVFIGKLRDRQINPSTMTLGFQRRIAEELKVPLDLVVAHLAAEQVPLRQQFFKAEGKPSTGGQQTFEEAVKSSGLSEDQQRSLLEL